jgi:hypothetical protein
MEFFHMENMKYMLIQWINLSSTAFTWVSQYSRKCPVFIPKLFYYSESFNPLSQWNITAYNFDTCKWVETQREKQTSESWGWQDHVYDGNCLLKMQWHFREPAASINGAHSYTQMMEATRGTTKRTLILKLHTYIISLFFMLPTNFHNYEIS